MNWITEFLGTVHPSLTNLQGAPLYIFVVVVMLTVAFLVGYGVKGTQVALQLNHALRGVRSLKLAKRTPSAAEMAPLFQTEPLRHLWDEYADTLHELRKASSGDLVLSEVRATVPAETLFTREVLVDSRLFDDFTRHLPGVLTGLGIIGTFAGLLQGLDKFDPTSSATAVAGLKPLLEGVSHAFVASGVAIGCAMGVVFLSRLVLAYFYRLVEQLAHGIDSLYAGGAGEEYLARLVKASEQNEAHTAQLKDSLVEDLTKLMTNLVDRQIAAHEGASRALGEQLGDSISTALAEPMRRVGEVMEQTTKGNGEQVNNMLETLLTGFMAKLEDTFGGQMRGINEQMQRSMDSMAAVQSSLQGLLADIKQTNEHAASQMSGTLEEAMKKSADNQQLLTEQMRQFVQDFRNLVNEEQAKSKRAMDDAVMKVLGEVSIAMEKMEEVRRSAAVEESGRNQALSSQTNQLVGGLTAQVDGLLKTVSEQVTRTQQNINALGDVSLRAIDGMNQGALTMGSAAQKFETAGSTVTGVFDRAGKLSEQMASTASGLQAAAGAVQRGFEQYDLTRKTVDAQVASLTGLIEAARKEAGVSKDLIDAIKSSVEALRRAESESRAHLDKVNDALIKAFNDFGTALVSQVKNTIAETDRHLSQGTGHLNGVVQELATAVHRMKKA
ncbi:anti-phage ZorAB system protein ZorA [Hydrogenophaga atypica]|uniref:Anti-phage ZorAB system protein ZorA n=1 Tax=Hydrogenophaga atypica TaxID=249409 RepID=A0ABW2QLR3_9BURK